MATIRFGILLTLGILLGALAVGFPAGAASVLPDPCDASIELASSTSPVAVSSTDGATGRGSGSVSFKRIPAATITVNITASTDNGFPVTVDPATAMVNNVSRVDFVFTFQAPAAAAAGEEGHVTINARVSVNGFACTAPDPAIATIYVVPYVDVFGGRIPADSRHPVQSGVGENFDIEVDVRSNAPMRVTFTYTASGGFIVDGPAAIDVEPTFTFVTTRTIHVSAHADHLQAGNNGVDVVVRGSVQNLGDFTGHLGVVTYVPPAALETPGLNLSGVLIGLLVAALVAVPIQLHQRRRARRTAAVLRLKRIVAETRAAGAAGASLPSHVSGRNGPGY